MYGTSITALALLEHLRVSGRGIQERLVKPHTSFWDSQLKEELDHSWVSWACSKPPSIFLFVHTA